VEIDHHLEITAEALNFLNGGGNLDEATAAKVQTAWETMLDRAQGDARAENRKINILITVTP
jgi:hypothetical protein